ncbi:MAG: nucleotidyltransferase domain-containing protein [Firmicutes bacterium]|nr:nucleotidyltransferase domain-containing protein [Bacillota bacterium]
MQFNQEIESIINAIIDAVPAHKIYLFGSFADGTQKPDSDYDLFIVLDDDANMKPLEAAQKAHRALLSIDNLNTPVDILADYKSSFKQRRQLNVLEKEIYQKGIVLYEQK